MCVCVCVCVYVCVCVSCGKKAKYLNMLNNIPSFNV